MIWRLAGTISSKGNTAFSLSSHIGGAVVVKTENGATEEMASASVGLATVSEPGKSTTLVAALATA